MINSQTSKGMSLMHYSLVVQFRGCGNRKLAQMRKLRTPTTGWRRMCAPEMRCCEAETDHVNQDEQRAMRAAAKRGILRFPIA